jgi:hypothetical protein
LLADIRDGFVAKKVDRLASEELVDCLDDLDELPWPEFKAGKPISKTRIGRLLKSFRIKPENIRFGDRVPKGYRLSTFADAFARYLP